MKQYEFIAGNRMDMVRRIEALTGVKPDYTRAPRYAFEFGAYTVERGGMLLATDNADMTVIETLIAEGFIAPANEEPTESEPTADGQADEPDEMNPADSPADEQDDAELAEDQVSDPDATDPADGQSDDPDETNPSDDTQTDSVINIDGPVNILKPEISFPTSKHNGNSLKNLLYLIYSRGNLISKATGGEFNVDEELVNKLKNDETIEDYESFASSVAAYEDENGAAISGLLFTPEKVTFTGFPETGNPEKIRAFIDLATVMNRQAIIQKRIQPRKMNEENEKYIFRIWLVRIGMDGTDTKQSRRILMENLSGNSAFRTPAEEEKWKARQKARKEKMKSEAEAASAGDDAPEQVSTEQSNAGQSSANASYFNESGKGESNEVSEH